MPKETTWDDLTEHGYISIFDTAGNKLAHRDGFQHNRKLRKGGAWDGAAVEAVLQDVSKALSNGAVKSK